jgi:uncharacterized membrane protein YjfL (UPF0719 family)
MQKQELLLSQEVLVEMVLWGVSGVLVQVLRLMDSVVQVVQEVLVEVCTSEDW